MNFKNDYIVQERNRGDPEDCQSLLTCEENEISRMGKSTHESRNVNILVILVILVIILILEDSSRHDCDHNEQIGYRQRGDELVHLCCF